MNLSELMGLSPDSCGGALISGIQLDSRRVRPGDLFIAVPGEVHDGRQFIEQAVANGAAAVAAEPPVSGFVEELQVPLVEVPELRMEVGYIAARFYRHPSRDLHMIGVTGTNGKTTTSRLLAQLGRSLGKPWGVIGTLGVSLDGEVQETRNTTPDAAALQKQLACWRDESVFAVGMEVSSHALVQGRVNGVEFDTGVYTNLSRDHLDYHGSMEAYSRAKMQLFTGAGLRHAVLNADDDYTPLLRASISDEVRIITYSSSGAEADVRVESPNFHAGGVDAVLHSPWGSGEFSSPLTGDFNLANLAAAVSALALAGEDLLAVLDAIPALGPVPGRMESIDNDQGLQVIVDYAHTPDALEQVLGALRAHVEGQLIIVFGCGGDRDQGKRQLMGRVACQLSDRVLVTSDNPRSEDPAAIMNDIATGCCGDFELIEDRAEAIGRALRTAEPGDCIVIAGKGHEAYQLVEGEHQPFSDAEQAREALARRAAG
jgi:UDP-N-acetylmuramoyl-L-alanyl-D-glutamate--2,6-diaminopimelate ligase